MILEVLQLTATLLTNPVGSVETLHSNITTQAKVEDYKIKRATAIVNNMKPETRKKLEQDYKQQKRLGYEKGSLIDYINRVYDDSWLVKG